MLINDVRYITKLHGEARRAHCALCNSVFLSEILYKNHFSLLDNKSLCLTHLRFNKNIIISGSNYRATILIISKMDYFSYYSSLYFVLKTTVIYGYIRFITPKNMD